MADNTQTEDPRVTLQGLLGLLQPTPNPQSANAALGQGTTNVLNNAANLTGNKNIAAGNYDTTQNTGINQQQLVQVLQGLTNMGGASSKNVNTNPNSIPIINDSQQSAQQSPYQKGVQKALQESGYKHANEALAAGMPPEQIANHPAAGGGQQQDQVNPQAMAALQQLLNQSQQGNNVQSSNTNPTGAYQSQNGVDKFFNMLGFTPTPQNQALLAGAQATRQKVGAGNPAETSVPTAQAAQTNAQAEYQRLQNSGNKPIDPEQYLNAYSNMYQKAYDAYSKDEEAGAQMSKDALEQYNSLAEKARGPLDKFTGTQTQQMQKTLQAAAASLKASIDARTNFHSFMIQNSPSQVIGNIKNKVSSQNNSPSNNNDNGSGINIGDKFNGEKVISVKRIK